MLPREGGAARDVRDLHDRARGEREEPRVGTPPSVERGERPPEIVRHTGDVLGGTRVVLGGEETRGKRANGPTGSSRPRDSRSDVR